MTFFYPNLKHAQTVYISIRRYTWSARCTKCLFCDSTGFRPLLPILVFILSLNWCNVKTFFNLTTYGRVLMIQFLKCSKQLTLQKLSFLREERLFLLPFFSVDIFAVFQLFSDTTVLASIYHLSFKASGPTLLITKYNFKIK